MCVLASGLCRRWTLVALLAAVAAHIVAAVIVAAAQQSQEVINANHTLILSGVEARLRALEDGRLLVRVAVLEESMGEIKWLTRGVTLAVVTQLAMALVDWRKAKR